MLHACAGLVAALLVSLDACRAAPQSAPGAGPAPGTRPSAGSSEGLRGRQLQGRFLHITDIHPDPFFKTYSSTEEAAACHRKRGPAGVYGAETSGCDSPISLVNETFKWISENLRDEVDFVVWTGDSARHDNDEKIPRTQKQIIQQNEFVVSKFREVWGKKKDDDEDPTNDFTIPIVPTFGNNDIMPHNIFLSGPNKWTYKYLEIWRNFIPEAQRHQFQQGGWFYQEVIPERLAVLSLNTMYFFDSNSGVDGCANKHEPGYEHMEWLRIQLQILRERGLKVILMGHVPPARTEAKLSWDETCWQKYTLWEHQYRDIIVGSLFGHMNVDHFMLHDYKDVWKDARNGKMANTEDVKIRESMLEDGELTINSASDYLVDLRRAWAKLPTPPKSNKKGQSLGEYIDEEEEEKSLWERLGAKLSTTFGKGKKGKDDGKKKKDKKKKFLKKIGGPYAERYSTSHVAPSVVPNYFPTLRVFTYNISTLEGLLVQPPQGQNPPSHLPHYPQGPLTDSDFQNFSDDEEYKAEIEVLVKRKKKEKEQRRKKPRKYKFKVPAGPDKTSPPGPAYSPQTLSLLGYTQYFANLTRINNDFVAPGVPARPIRGSDLVNEEVVVEENEVDSGIVTAGKWKEGKHGKHQGKKPRPKPHPKKFRFEVEYDTRHDKAFKLKDLTVRSYVDLARRIGQKKMRKADLDEEEEVVDDSDEESDDGSGDEVEAEKKGKKHKKEGKKHKKKNETWLTFVKRAFVGTMDPRDVEQNFGLGVQPQSTEESSEAPQEVFEEEIMEL